MEKKHFFGNLKIPSSFEEKLPRNLYNAFTGDRGILSAIALLWLLSTPKGWVNKQWARRVPAICVSSGTWTGSHGNTRTASGDHVYWV